MTISCPSAHTRIPRAWVAADRLSDSTDRGSARSSVRTLCGEAAVPEPETPAQEPETVQGASAMSADARLKWAAAGLVSGIAVSSLVYSGLLIAAESSDADAAVRGARPALDLPIGWLLVAQLPLWAGMLGPAVMARRHGLDWKTQLGWRIRAVDIPAGIASGVFLQLAVMPLLYRPIFWISRVTGSGGLSEADVRRPAQEFVGAAGTPLEIGILILMVVVVAPVAEEVCYRGLLQGALSDRLSTSAAVAGSALIFAAMHLQPIQFPALLLIGVIHGTISAYSKRLRICFIISCFFQCYYSYLSAVILLPVIRYYAHPHACRARAMPAARAARVLPEAVRRHRDV